jgi:hypothetical protein
MVSGRPGFRAGTCHYTLKIERSRVATSYLLISTHGFGMKSCSKRFTA